MHEKGKIAVLGIHPGSLLNYWSALNELGHYSVVLSGSVEELVELLERGERFELLLVDDLGKSLHTRSLELLAWYEAIGSIIAVADANSQERQALFRYNPSRDYVAAVSRYARRIHADWRAYYAYYAWQVYVRR